MSAGAAGKEFGAVSPPSKIVDMDRKQLLDLVGDRYPVVARSLLRPLLELLSSSREACGGDMDKFL
ncbi:MAG: hypothetical protein JWO33_2753, partial [Caulobacteraceae bacterium]|nr:hypothetical protein [Caulobacteraceae bacterium]